MKEMAAYEPRSGFSSDSEYASALTLGFPASRNVTNKFLLFISNPVNGIFVTAARMKIGADKESSRKSLLVLAQGIGKGMHNTQRECGNLLIFAFFYPFPYPSSQALLR